MRIARLTLSVVELAVLTAAVMATRCANYPEVFVRGNIYFTDADCYARMTRVRMCAEHPGLVVRHHDFENFPEGTNPHTTAPLDYLVVGLSILLRPFTSQPLDPAGAWISPLLGLLAGWFLWWWSRRMKFRYRWAALTLYATSPILVHGTELGRPDHQSLLMLLVTVALCAHWTLLHTQSSPAWQAISGCAWALGIWVSAYEPLVLFIALLAVSASATRWSLFASGGRVGWAVFAAVLLVALVIERRLPSMSILHGGQLLSNWSHSIGELRPTPLFDRIWFSWVGYLVLLAPVLLWLNRHRREIPRFIAPLLVVTFALTIWQARWGYFFVLLFALALPVLLEGVSSPIAVWAAFTLSILPIARDWDARLWPNDAANAQRAEQRNETMQLHALATMLRSDQVHSFLAPWWLSPQIVYWSGQPGVAGSAHEGIMGIADSARFYLTSDVEEAREIVLKRNIAWVFAYDAERVAANSAQVLHAREPAPESLCYVLDHTPSHAPHFLGLTAQTAAAKLYRVTPPE